MKDQVFSGPDVPGAVAMASRALGVPPDKLRYVVIEAGNQGALGMKGSVAQIAVLLDAPAPGASRAVAVERPAESSSASPDRDLQAALRAVVREFARAADVELESEIVPEESGGLLVRIGGADAKALQRQEVDALVHVLQKAGSRGTLRVPVAVECGGGRIGRDEELRATARTLGTEVARTGAARETPPLNGYERRVVHTTLAGEAGLETYSVGEGEARRVRIAPRVGGAASEVM